MNDRQEAVTKSVFREGQSVWKIAHADRAAVLLDAADYFAALRSAMATARRSIFVLGWDIDSRMRLVGRSGKAEDGAPDTLRPYLEYLVKQRPDLEVRLLLWDYTLLFALDREPLPSLNLRWRTPPRVKVALDSDLPLGACHHQKIVVIDGNLAFCGGIDLTTRRWDNSEHHPGHPLRVDANDKPYPPFHDMQMIVDGDAAQRFAEICAHRWREATGEELTIKAMEVNWPQQVRPDFEDLDVGIARTMPETDDRQAVTEVLELYLASIHAARRYIYIETQYLTSDEIAEALISRMRDVPELEVVVVTPHASEGWLEKRTMGEAQQKMMHKLTQDGLGPRIRFLHPWVGHGHAANVMVHAKLMIVDDLILRVGSSNLNNRSMHVDTECDLAVLAMSDQHRTAIRSMLHRLLGEHLGVASTSVLDSLQETGSIIEVTKAFRQDERGLAPLKLKSGQHSLADTLNLVVDPEEPIRPAEFIVDMLGDMFGADRGGRFAFGRVVRLAAVAFALLALALVWSYTPLADFADPEALADALDSVRGKWWIYAALLASFVLGGMVLFPVTVLITVTGMLLGPWTGWLCAIAGTMTSAWVGYAAGLWLGGTSIQQVSGRAFYAVARSLKNQGIVAVAALRMVPVAPFTIVNMAMGVAGVGARTYLVGTALGMFPGAFVLTMLGDRLRETWRDPGPANILLFSVIIVLWLGLAFALQRLVVWLRNRER